MTPSTGISYIEHIKSLLLYDSTDLTNKRLRLDFGTELIDIMNCQTFNKNEIARIEPIPLSSGLINRIDLRIYDYNANGLSFNCFAVFLKNQNNINIRVYVKYKNDNTYYTIINTITFGSKYINISDTSYDNVDVIVVRFWNTVGDLDIERLWLGNYLETCNDSVHSTGYTSKSGRRDSRGGISTLQAQSKYKITSHEYSMIPRAEAIGLDKTTYEDMAYKSGKDSEILVLPDVTTDDIMYSDVICGTLQNDIILQHQGAGKYQTKLDVKGLF